MFLWPLAGSYRCEGGGLYSHTHTHTSYLQHALGMARSVCWRFYFAYFAFCFLRKRNKEEQDKRTGTGTGTGTGGLLELLHCFLTTTYMAFVLYSFPDLHCLLFSHYIPCHHFSYLPSQGDISSLYLWLFWHEAWLLGTFHACLPASKTGTVETGRWGWGQMRQEQTGDRWGHCFCAGMAGPCPWHSTHTWLSHYSLILPAYLSSHC